MSSDAEILLDPIPRQKYWYTRIVAPISTVVFVPTDLSPGSPLWIEGVPKESNIPAGKHFTDIPPPGSILLEHNPKDQLVALFGDIVATRLKTRGVLGAIANGRGRDFVSSDKVCDENFTMWCKGLSTVGTSMEAKPWAVDVPVKIGKVEVNPGDIMVADEGERGIAVIPRDKLKKIVEMLAVQKKADDGLLNDVRNGQSMADAIKNWPEHYSVQPH
ncbi:RraA-like protein [Rhizodiscina lignyota]|uniref:RraA-like protein n=1 Tax=Rhizodiscina lignyota TaxID=1504668 RepID=A0A9P4I1H4_9PEZI|nr:RraA-like protein [Rhizodiscina lignyota]